MGGRVLLYILIARSISRRLLRGHSWDGIEQRVHFVHVHETEDGEGTLRVGRRAVAVVLAVRPGTDVLVQALSRAHAVVEPGIK